MPLVMSRASPDEGTQTKHEGDTVVEEIPHEGTDRPKNTLKEHRVQEGDQ